MPDQSPGHPLRPEHFRRYDETPDRHFYSQPRFVTHIDDAAIEALTRHYRDVLPAGGAILDLMSSWVSHLPDDVEYAEVAGLGMSAEELERNSRLTERVVHDLNEHPRLPFDNERFDAVVVAVSVQYLTQPVEVFADVARVLKPGAPFVVSFSNRCFPTKAVGAWQMLDDGGHAELVGLYFRLSGGFDSAQAMVLVSPGGPDDPLYAVSGTALPEHRRRPPAPIIPA